MGRIKVDVAIVGAQKSGTTWLSQILDLHPSITLVEGKEAHLFDQSEVQAFGVSPEHFNKLFPNQDTGKKLLDATPTYLYLPGCLEALKTNNPQVKVIAILRDPGQRAVSHYYHSKRMGFEKRSILGALKKEKHMLARDFMDYLHEDSSWRHHSYMDRGRYFQQIKNLKALFPDALVIPFPQIVSQPAEVLEKVQEFLEIEVIDLQILPSMNSFGKNPKHTFIIKFINMRVRHNLQETFKVLGWSKNELIEGSAK